MSEGDSGLHLSGWRQPDGLSTPVLGSARGLPGSLAKVSSQEPETPGHAPHRSPPPPPRMGRPGGGGAAGSRSGGRQPLVGTSAPSLSPPPTGCRSHLFIYNLLSASFQESSEALAEKLLPQAGLCSHQPWAPSPWTLSPWLASPDVSAWRPGRTGSGPRDRPSLPRGSSLPSPALGATTLPPGCPLEPRWEGTWGQLHPSSAPRLSVLGPQLPSTGGRSTCPPPLDLAQPWKGPECCGGRRGGPGSRPVSRPGLLHRFPGVDMQGGKGLQGGSSGRGRGCRQERGWPS